MEVVHPAWKPVTFLWIADLTGTTGVFHMDDMKGSQSNNPLLVAEGDSWLNLRGPDLEEALESQGYKVKSDAKAGARLQEMITDEQLEKLRAMLNKVQGSPQAMILSGGGNDFLDRFDRCLHPREYAVDNDNVSIEKMFNESGLESVLKELKELYRKWFDEVSKCMTREWPKTRIPILIHSYACPSIDEKGLVRCYFFRKGPWLQQGFIKRGWVPKINKKRKQEVVRQAFEGLTRAVRCTIDAHNKDSTYNEVRHVDVATVVKGRHWKKGPWNDQIHLTRDGYGAVAKEFHKVIKSL